MADNMKCLLPEYLIELHLEFVDNLFPYYSASIYLSIQICTSYQNESFEFVRLEEPKEPQVKSIPEEQGYEW